MDATPLVLPDQRITTGYVDAWYFPALPACRRSNDVPIQCGQDIAELTVTERDHGGIHRGLTWTYSRVGIRPCSAFACCVTRQEQQCRAGYQPWPYSFTT
jgi:hypothetical protein